MRPSWKDTYPATPLTNKETKAPRGEVLCLRSHSNGQSGDRKPGLLSASPHHRTTSWREWDSAGSCLALEGRWADEWGRFIKKDSGHIEWEILDNLSFLSEVMEMVKRGRINYNISGKHSPDTHKRYHFLWVFILSKCFYCTGLEWVQTRKAPLLFIEQNSVPPGAPPSWLTSQ